MRKIITGFVIASFLVYIYFLYIMLFMGFGRENIMLSEHMQLNYAINLIPFKTIIEYITAIIDGSMRGHAIRNLGGNLSLLFPLGFYFPFFMQKISKIKTYIIFVAALIIVIEIIQVLTMTGSLDVDDFILNFVGALIGFIVFTRTSIRSLFKLRA